VIFISYHKKSLYYCHLFDRVKNFSGVVKAVFSIWGMGLWGLARKIGKKIYIVAHFFLKLIKKHHVKRGGVDK